MISLDPNGKIRNVRRYRFKNISATEFCLVYAYQLWTLNSQTNARDFDPVVLGKSTMRTN